MSEKRRFADELWAIHSTIERLRNEMPSGPGLRFVGLAMQALSEAAGQMDHEANREASTKQIGAKQ